LNIKSAEVGQDIGKDWHKKISTGEFFEHDGAEPLAFRLLLSPSLIAQV
jgi:hypothetical protein